MAKTAIPGEFHYHGYTALLDNVQAAVLDIKLRHSPQWIEYRRQIAMLYRQGLQEMKEITLPHFEGHEYQDSYQNYVIRARDRDALHMYLKDEGVETLISFSRPLWSHTALELGDLRLPMSEQLCHEVISLPMSAETTSEEVEITVQTIRAFYNKPNRSI